MLRQRHHAPNTLSSEDNNDPARSSAPTLEPTASTTRSPQAIPTSSSWLIFAVTSGACAAFNGVFAKLYVQVAAHLSVHHGPETHSPQESNHQVESGDIE